MHAISPRRASTRRGFNQIEGLERRALMSTVVVNTVMDQTDAASSKTISLRDAVTIADKSTTATQITFSPTVFASAKTIVLGSRLELSNAAKATTITGPAASLSVSGNAKTRVVLVDAGVTLSISNLSITNGQANDHSGDGGGIYVAAGGKLSLSGVTLSGNATTSNGSGAGLANFGTATLTNVSVVNNAVRAVSGSGIWGGGIFNGGSLAYVGGIITGNSSGEGGGGIFNAGVAVLTNLTVSSNTTKYGNGGGLQNRDVLSKTAVATVTGCTFSGNSTQAEFGGGVGSDRAHTNSGTTTIHLINVTISGNTAGKDGGGLWLDASNTGSTVAGLTIANNTAAVDGGGLEDQTGTTASTEAGFANTIIAGNKVTGKTSKGPDVSGAVDSLGHNLIGKTNGSTGWLSTDFTGTIAKPLNADLGSLSSNGGPTFTLLPLAGSPAINDGSHALIPAGITTDQRGLARIVGSLVDIGAVEVQTVK